MAVMSDRVPVHPQEERSARAVEAIRKGDDPESVINWLLGEFVPAARLAEAEKWEDAYENVIHNAATAVERAEVAEGRLAEVQKDAAKWAIIAGQKEARLAATREALDNQRQKMLSSAYERISEALVSDRDTNEKETPHEHDWSRTSMCDTGSDPQRWLWQCACGDEQWSASSPTREDNT